MIEIFVYGLRDIDAEYLADSFLGLTGKLKEVVVADCPKSEEIKKDDIACLFLPAFYTNYVVAIIEGLTVGSTKERDSLAKAICTTLAPHTQSNIKGIRCRIRVSRGNSGFYELELADK